jgi:hypothetical protein
MKLFIAIVALFVCASANAAGSIPVGLCYSLANLAESAARARDSGMPEAHAGKAVIEQHMTPSVEGASLDIIHVTYNSKVTPRRASDAALKACLDQCSLLLTPVTTSLRR